jgi:hypothetical protein
MSRGLSADQRLILTLLNTPISVTMLADYVYAPEDGDPETLDRWRWDVEFKRQRRKSVKRAVRSLEERGLVRTYLAPDEGDVCAFTGERVRKRAGNGVITMVALP